MIPVFGHPSDEFVQRRKREVRFEMFGAFRFILGRKAVLRPPV